MRFLLVVDRCAASAVEAAPPLAKRQLESFGYYVLHAQDEQQIQLQLGKADAIIVHSPLDEVNRWGAGLLKQRTIPMLWWCSADAASLSSAYCELDVALDGILTPSMSEREVHWALQLGARQCVERLQWHSQRKQLEDRLEERKWIDMAKGILCKIKGISEAEAYEFLRKQAMNERKRMVDVATSIVRVHHILQNQE